MAIRTSLAPNVEIKEIDKSQYTPFATGTTVYLNGFSPKGEPYRPMEITTRAAFEQIYGAPDTEAERYFYAGACETLNQGGRLFCARLPYDNGSFEKIVGVKYTIESQKESIDDFVISQISALDSNLSSKDNIATISCLAKPVMYDLSTINMFRENEARPPADTFTIVDITNGTYGSVVEDDRKGQKREVIGIIPVVTTAPNALLAQSYISLQGEEAMSCTRYFESLKGSVLSTLIAADGLSNDGLKQSDLVQWIATDEYFTAATALTCSMVSTRMDETGVNVIGLSTISSVVYEKAFNVDTTTGKVVGFNQLDLNSASYPDYDKATCELMLSAGYDFQSIYDNGFKIHGKDGNDAIPNTIALDAAGFFPPIQPKASDDGGLDPEHLKDIGIVVYKAYLDPASGNKVNVEPVEAFAGSLCKDDKDPNTLVTKFIDDIVNSNSKYINIFSNCFTKTESKKFYTTSCDMLYMMPSPGCSLGFYSEQTKKDISISKSILEGLNKAYEKVENVNELDIDIVPDAGIANIGSYLKAIFEDKGPYDLNIVDDLGNSLLSMWKCKSATDPCVKMWKTILLKRDNFCKNIRKDCMFVADGLRPLVIAGQKKIVRDSMPTNSIDKDILPYVKAICGLNTSYGAGYADWFEQADDYTGDFFWCPPSIKATGVYINTDVNYDYWLAPAGLTRGVIAATDIAFNPNIKQAGSFYEKNWNYAINYPQDGIILEGQKTFQTKSTALDRVNVRRTLLRLERQVYKVLRYFLYEGNTAYTRQRIVDAIEPILKDCWQGGNGGLQRYKIRCNEENNPPEVIDNNEVHVQIGVVPTKSIEWIICNFLIGRQGSTWQELFEG